MGITVRYRPARDRWVVTETNDGQRHQYTFAGTREGERQAREFAAKRETELNEAIFQGKRMGRQRRRSFLEGLARWIDEYDVDSQIKAIRPVAAYMGDEVLLGQETVDKARAMARDLRLKGRAQSTVNNHLQVVKRVLNLAYREWGWLDQAYGDKLQKRSPKNERHVYLNVQEIGELLAAIPENKTIEKKIIALAALTGLRQGELLALEPSNIQRGRILLRANQTKSGKARSVPVPGYALPWLEELPFQTTYSRLRVVFENARRDVGRDGLRFHDLRHSYASMLAQAGESMTTVRDLLGHSSLVVTSRYSHIFDDGLDDVAARLPSLGEAFCDQNATSQKDDASGKKGKIS